MVGGRRRRGRGVRKGGVGKWGGDWGMNGVGLGGKRGGHVCLDLRRQEVGKEKGR